MSNGTTYRRGSVFGALLLIAIGALFLYANMNPDFTPWPILAKYWPVLIIFWGLSRLVDYLMLRNTEQAAAVTRLSAGDIIGVIFILLFGTLFTQAVRYGTGRGGPLVIGDEEVGCIFGSQYEFSDQVQQAVSGTVTLNLKNERGNITVGVAPGNEIRVSARKTVCASSDAEGLRLAQAYKPVLDTTGGGYEFRWDTQAGASGLVRTDLDIQVPEAINVTLATRRGDATVKGLRGEVNLTVDRGDVDVRNVTGNVEVNLHRGDVQANDIGGGIAINGSGDKVEIRNTRGAASLQGEFYGPIRFTAIGGPATFNSARTNLSAAKIDGEMIIESGELTLRNVPGDVSLVTRDKEIDAEGISGEIRIENRNGRVAVRVPKPPGYAITVDNRSGNIELALPASSGFQIMATARNGEVESDFSGGELSKEGEDSDTQTLRGTYGNGKATIRLSTTHGNIYLRRSGS